MPHPRDRYRGRGARGNNVEVYHDIERSAFTGVMALSSGFMTYPPDAHPSYSTTCGDIARDSETFVLLPSLDLKTCVAEIVRRQLARGRTRPSQH